MKHMNGLGSPCLLVYGLAKCRGNGANTPRGTTRGGNPLEYGDKCVAICETSLDGIRERGNMSGWRIVLQK